MRRQFTKLLMLVALMLPLALMAQEYHSVPYFEDFESPTGTPGLPTGWVNYQTGTSGSGTFPCCYLYPGNARNGSYYFELESSTSQTELVATCEFANVSNLMLDFYYCINSSYAPAMIEIGVMEDTTFVPVDTMNFTTVNSWNTYTHYRMYFVDYAGYGTRIAFRATKLGGQYTVFIDDMTIANAPTCAYMPSNVSVTADSSSADLTWTDASVSAGYMLYLNNDSTWHYTYSNNYTFYGLTANTNYSGYLYNTCSGSDTSEAVAFSFRTACGMTTYPMYEDFNSYGSNFPSCWARSETSGNYPLMASEANRMGGGYGIEFYNYSQNISVATPFLYRAVNELETKFWVRKSSTYYDAYLAVGYVSSLDSVSNAVMVDTITVGPDWEEHLVSFANIDYTGEGYIVFRKLAGGYADIYLDDVTLREVLDCSLPTNFVVTGTASEEMTFSWTDSVGYAWQIAYGAQGMDVDTATNVVDFYSDSVTVTGLSDTITYDFYLRTDCGGAYSYWVGPITARPNLIVMTANGTDTVRNCGGTLVDDGGLTGDFSAYQTSRVVLYPNVDGQAVSLRGVATIVGAYSYYTNSLKIYDGVGTSGRLLGSWDNSSNDSVNVTSTTGPLTVTFESSVYGGEGFVLNISCSDMANCIDPWDVTVSDIAGASAVVHWNYSDATPAQDFTIIVTDTLTGASNSFTADDTARSYTITDLNQTTNYRVSVVANCLSGDMSNEVSTYFLTNCYVGGEIAVGDNNIALSSHPFNTYYNYTISQSIYGGAEVITLTDTIFGIKIFRNSGPTATRNVDVYIDSTSVNTFASGSSFIPMDTANRVFSGSLTLHDGWNEIRFNTPWIRPSMTSNILLTFDDNTGSYVSGTTYWRGSSNNAGKTVQAYSDGTNYNPLGTLSLSVTPNRPDVMFMAPCADANCVAPAVSIAGTDSNSITINWVPGMNEYEWTVEYKLASDTVWNVFTASTSTQTATVTGLASNTMYDFRVGSICLIGDVPFSYISGRTGCATMSVASLPYFEGFEGLSTGDVPLCWTAPVTGNSGAGTFPACYNYSYNARNGNVYFEVESSTAQTEIFAMPAFESIDGLELEFYMATGGTYSPDVLEMGVIENDTAFVVLDTINLSAYSNIYDYRREIYRFNYAGSNVRIAMRATKASGSYTIFMDDFTLYVPNPCDSVTNIVVDTLTTTGFDLSWTDDNNVGSYVVKIGTSSDPALATDTYTTSSTNYSFTGLASSTTYYVFVYTNCASGLSDVNGVVVNTPCEAVATFPFVEDFESGLGLCYDQIFVSGNHSWTVTTTSSNPSGAHSGSQVAAYTHSTSGSETMLVLPTFDFSSLNNGAQLNYWHTQAVWTPDQDELYVYYRTSLTGTWTEIQSFTNNITSWTEELVNLPNSANAPIYQIAFKGVDRYGYGVKLDDIVVAAASSCSRPDSLAASVTESVAVLTWNGNASEYVVEYRQAGTTAATAQSTIGATATITGLDAMTAYEFRVQGVCSASDSSMWSVWTPFTTAMCANVTEIYNYDSTQSTTTTNYAPLGYSYYNYGYTQTIIDHERLNGLSDDITAFAFTSVSGTSGDYFNHMDVYLANVPDSTLENGFILPDSNVTFVKVITDGDFRFSEAGTFLHAFDTVFTWDGHSNILVSVNRRHGSYGMYAEFAGHNSNGVKSRWAYNDGSAYDINTVSGGYTGSYTGDIILYACAEGCAAPRILSETHNYESATIAWTGSNSFQVAIKANDATDWPAETAVTGNTYTFTGLLPATAYTFRVRQDCSADENGYSAWTYGTFITDSLPCFAPENLTASNITGDAATFAWTALGAETNWEIHVWRTGVVDVTVPVNTNPATVTG
ncbi:MAG: fibronectin type III domain-containing protein, partial [Bacteroidales bacterium]|nr:fibronectin type III domain-containing protein [Bacteroidales bacterium]